MGSESWRSDGMDVIVLWIVESRHVGWLSDSGVSQVQGSPA